jgi:RNA polymerase sigma factor (sigma-70 family)
MSFIEIAPRLLMVLMKRFGVSKEEAGDVLDETLVKLLGQVRASRTPRSFERLNHEALTDYLATAVANRYRDHLKHRYVVQRSEQELLLALEEVPTPESEFSREEHARRLRAAVRQLRPSYRGLFEALLNEDITLAELARRRRIKPGTVYTQFRRGLEALRDIWELQTRAGSSGQDEPEIV